MKSTYGISRVVLLLAAAGAVSACNDERPNPTPDPAPPLTICDEDGTPCRGDVPAKPERD